MSLGLPISPSRTIDVSSIFGAAAGYFVARAYDGPGGHRFTFGGEPQGEGVTIPDVGMPSFQALVGGVSLVSTAPIDFTETGTYNVNLPSMPGWYAVPVAMKLVATAVTATAGPTLSVGNGTGIDGSGTDNMAPAQGGWEVASVPAQMEIGAASAAPLVSLSTPIQVKVITAATGGAFTGFVLLALQLFQLE